MRHGIQKVVEFQKPKRKGLSKRIRFEIFKRDEFTCQYCHRKEVLLEIDHIQPLSKGGTDDWLNLITSCEDCNRGKSDRELFQIPVSPDAEMERLRINQEILETQRYLEARQHLDEFDAKLIAMVRRSWVQSFEQETRRPLTNIELPDRQAKVWLSTYTPWVIDEALEVVGGYVATGAKVFTQRHLLFAYISAVLRNIANAREDAEE